jgi:hypothetical protein
MTAEAPYPDMSTINNTDLSNILVYANDLSDGYLSPGTLMAFFMIIAIGSFFMQKRFTGRGRFELSFAAAGFSTTGMAVLMSLKEGLLDVQYLIISIIVSVIGAIWLYFQQD